MTQLLYLDVGGTSTRLWLEQNGKTLRKMAWPTRMDALAADLRSALKKFPKKVSLTAGLRGAWTADEKNAWKKKFRGFGRKVHVVSDIELAHTLAFGNEPGIVLNAGTGSIAFGKNKKGKTARAGGFGPLLGDEGSAFWIGREYLKMLSGAPKNLSLVRSYARHPQAVREIAGLARLVLRKAKRNPQSVYGVIVRKAQTHLINLVLQVKRELKMPDQTAVVLVGGVFESHTFKKAFPFQKPVA